MATRYRKCKNIFLEQFPNTENLYISYQTVSDFVTVYSDRFELLDSYSIHWQDAEEEGWGDQNNTEFHYKLDEYLHPIFTSCSNEEYRVSAIECEQFPKF